MTEAAGGSRSGGARARRGRRVCAWSGVDEPTEIPNGRPATLFDTNLYGILYLLVVPVQKKEPK